MTIRLQPWGVVTGRIVDDEAQPIGGLSLTNLYGFDRDNAGHGPGTQLGRDGRFRIAGLVPGLKCSVSALRGPIIAGQVFRDVIVAPGEVKDLGDRKLIPPG